MKDQENKNPRSIILKTTIIILAFFIVCAGVSGGLIYWQYLSHRVYIENAQVYAPIITLSPSTSGVLTKLFVSEGDTVKKNAIIAEVGGQSVKTQTEGTIIEVNNIPGEFMTPAEYVAKMIDPNELRVVGRIEEDKGLEKLKVGQPVIFTVDAFGSRKYYGTISYISNTARESDIAFSISDKREAKEFDIEATFDPHQYPELKNGMSAKMWVYT